IPILMNSKAGALKVGGGLDQMRRLVESVGVEAEVIATDTPEQMRAEIRRLVGAKAPVVAVAGGDGTIGRVVGEFAHQDTALAIIPQGTFNNFATALRLPADLPTALRVLHDGQVLEVSLGRIGDHYFTEVAGVGLFADALALYGSGTNKNFFRGVLAMLRVFFAMRPRRIRLFLDGEQVEERAVWTTVANSYRMAQGLPIAPGARLTDDHLDVIVVGDLRRREFIPYYRAIRAQLHRELPKVAAYQAREIRIETRRPMNVHADDAVVAVTPVTIKVEPRALKVMVDRL
ncbi:MAG TPA: diacylglycerol kinase family protein, partial [Fimbriimonadaceae bacterium]|nr:diacylglycerol kinase family protein [Fimbriimonadaceae bacterium]